MDDKLIPGAYYSVYNNDVLLAYHWPIKMYTAYLVCTFACHSSFVLNGVIFIGTIAAYSAYKKGHHTIQMTNDRPVYIYN